MNTSTQVTDKGQATIPKKLREKYDIEPGDKIIWMDTEEGLILKKRTQTAGRGLLVPDDTPKEKREAIAEELGQRLQNRRDRM